MFHQYIRCVLNRRVREGCTLRRSQFRPAQSSLLGRISDGIDILPHRLGTRNPPLA